MSTPLTAIYGGSFDPVHLGHIRLARYILALGIVDEIWMMPGRVNPLKDGVLTPASAADRVAMLSLAVEGIPGLRVDDTELHLPSPSYTYDTLCHLRRQHPDRRFTIIVGADNIEIFPKWRNGDKILSEFGVIAYPRPGYTLKGALPAGVTLLADAPQYDISSSAIRAAIAAGAPTDTMLPPSVASYIATHALYR